ncbi:hypothetical protein ILYODFUR_008487, partial [Ilyodon furcidens]
KSTPHSAGKESNQEAHGNSAGAVAIHTSEKKIFCVCVTLIDAKSTSSSSQRNFSRVSALGHPASPSNIYSTALA